MKADDGRGIHKGKMIAFGGDSSKLGHQNPMITSLGLDSPFLPPGTFSTPKLAGWSPFLFGLQELAH